ncbi:MAG: MFS transporter [Deltaproteobacteria bacterium]|jgi:MFS family permease|nr:MFS transporter [Deltaproteobacteria bacterium]
MPLTAAEERRILILAFGSTACMVMGVNSVMPIIPALAREFSVSQPTASLIITAFTLPGIAFTLFVGMLADRFGRKIIFTLSLLIFCLAGTACAFTDSFETLLLFRFLQGVGAAPLGVLNVTIIADTWSGARMAGVVGYNATVLSICTAVYPSLGGLLAHFNWRCTFLLPLLAVPVLLISLRTPLSNPGKAESFGRYLLGLARIFHTRRIAGLLAITGLTFLLLYGPIITCFPVLADARFNAGPAAIGGTMVISSLGAALTASQLGRLYARFSARALLLCSQIFYCLSMLLMVTFNDFSWIFLPILLFGIGQGMNTPNVQAQLMNAAGAEERAAVMSANGMLLRLGQTLAPVSFSFVMGGLGINSGFYLGIAFSVLLSALAIVYVSEKVRIT